MCLRAAGRQAIRSTGLVLAKALILCFMVGCTNQQLTIREAYQIPEPQGALLQQHTRPRCDFGAPSQLQTKAKDTWTPYSGKPENRPENTPPSQTAPETVDLANTYALLAKERDCYRQAEAKVRKKLHKLQASVDSTLSALQQETKRRVRINNSGESKLAAQGR